MIARRWRENHGNFLLAVAAGIILGGLAIMAIRRSPRFSQQIEKPFEEPDPEAILAEQAAAAGIYGPRQVVSIRILGAGSDEGKMKLAVYVTPEGFNSPEKAFDTDNWTIRDGVCEGKFGMPAEIKKLAIAAYHDENANGELDRNALGIPSERYGFTNNARGITGPPSFEDAVVEIGDKPIEISIR
jgi:uncharacterized protein (DUF2141 family)